MEMATLNSGTAPVIQPFGTTAEAKTCHPPLQRVVSTTLHHCTDVRPLDTVHAVIITFDDSYLKTPAGIVRIVQIVCSLICLVFLTSSGSHGLDYLNLPFAEHLRLFVFTCIAGFLLSTFMTVLRVTQTLGILQVNWNIFDLVVYSFLSLLFLMSSCLAANAVTGYQKIEDNSSKWTTQQLIGSVVFGFLCMLTNAITAALALRQHMYKVHQRIQKFQLSQQSSNSTFVEQL